MDVNIVKTWNCNFPCNYTLLLI